MNAIYFSSGESFWLTSDSLSVSTKFQISAYQSGIYNITVGYQASYTCREGVSSSQFELVVLQQGLFPSAPTVQAAVLSDDGLKIIFTFLANTNQAGTSLKKPQ